MRLCTLRLLGSLVACLLLTCCVNEIITYPAGPDKPGLNDDELWVSIDSVSLSSNPNPFNIDIQSHSQWRLLTDEIAPWCTVTPSGGTGNNRLRVKVSHNDTHYPRHTYITIIDQWNNTSTVLVRQQGFYQVIVSENYVECSETQTEFKVKVFSEAYALEALSIHSVPVWISVALDQNKNEITFIVQDNYLPMDRTCLIQISDPNGMVYHEIHIMQYGRAPESNSGAIPANFSAGERSAF